ncbi:c-type cytochrome [Pseudaminobacter sp. 19-2017]|uniref:C-type cytochrome n=1 Tax=Pseudaminobacter soli (ex Zhang et al. 2022) TaxID=2831468 RepID=A0A942E2R2_9HYPH|nr:c-type cytochrome [Pseudaminobacter soli]MBS3649946.1 c-type cytochrome [Pseudaminobacter soli]
MQTSFIVATFWVVALIVPGHAKDLGHGESEFVNSCAPCHGMKGQGDGPMAKELKRAPADLTRLAQRNGGRFPYSRVFATIDGRYIVPGHGSREMPVWGRKFLPADQALYGEAGGQVVTEERIHELTGYVQSLQR